MKGGSRGLPIIFAPSYDVQRLPPQPQGTSGDNLTCLYYFPLSPVLAQHYPSSNYPYPALHLGKPIFRKYSNTLVIYKRAHTIFCFPLFQLSIILVLTILTKLYAQVNLYLENIQILLSCISVITGNANNGSVVSPTGIYAIQPRGQHTTRQLTKSFQAASRASAKLHKQARPVLATTKSNELLLVNM